MPLFIFLICIACGVCSGVVYDVFYLVRSAICGVEWQKYTKKDIAFTALCDVLYFLILTAMFLFVSVVFNFYRIRWFMVLGCVLGVLLYLKSIHFLIAILAKKVYNKVVQKKECSHD